MPKAGDFLCDLNCSAISALKADVAAPTAEPVHAGPDAYEDSKRVARVVLFVGGGGRFRFAGHAGSIVPCEAK
jgi:hypothetical protein